jgi:hypothetical protein
VRLRSPRWVGGAVEREEDGLPCSGAKEMPASQAKARWRGRHGGEGCSVESAGAKVARRSAVVEGYRSASVR